MQHLPEKGLKTAAENKQVSKLKKNRSFQSAHWLHSHRVVLSMKMAEITGWGSVNRRGGMEDFRVCSYQVIVSLDEKVCNQFKTYTNFFLQFRQSPIIHIHQNPPHPSLPLSILLHLAAPANFNLSTTLWLMKATVFAESSYFFIYFQAFQCSTPVSSPSSKCHISLFCLFYIQE